ncbi:uncharacterized protein LOC132551121 [Ylistrum balloti]|uniref:uncharacterized protein LOC132551121 n=1 Tax=Ylistrum balloti TaxID=509963 RepID=UPI002905B345|nr:uncharacterized protein LOC132551121 [Ylistrum balloti]
MPGYERDSDQRKYREDETILQFACAFAVLLGTQACLSPQDENCGCIVSDMTSIDPDDYIFENLHTVDYQNFLQRMKEALHEYWVANTFIYTFPENIEPLAETGNPVCPTEQKHIFGYFKNDGLTLCLVVKPHIQNIKKILFEEPVCGMHTRCVPSGLVNRKYLVYCDALYTDEDGCLIGTKELSDTKPDSLDEDGFIDTSQPDLQPGNRKKRSWNKCPENKSYFAYRHDFLPTTCSARKCNCG